MNDKALAKPKIEAIYPLSNMQIALLFHHFTEKNDQGFLIVQSKIDGALNIDTFKSSWKQAAERHSILRTTVHWEKIKTPVQIVNQKTNIDISVLDWTDKDIINQNEDLDELKANKRHQGINFQKKPLSDIVLIQTSENKYLLLWVCHHLLLDGWSSSIILGDIFKYYQAIESNTHIDLPVIPSYKSYLNYIKQLNSEEAKRFWADTFNGFKNNKLVKSKDGESKILETGTTLSKILEDKIQLISKSYHITLNTLFQGVWALVIAKVSKSNDIAFGNTVSGRSLEFPNLDVMTGMFANVIPLRAKFSQETKINDWFNSIQTQQINARKYESISTNDIAEWTNIESDNFFDSLFIFENFPWENIKTESLTIHSWESGITTTFPITMVIKSKGETALNLFYDNKLFSEDTINSILDTFKEILDKLPTETQQTIEEILKTTKDIKFEKSENKTTDILKSKEQLILPQNKTELELLKIWESSLNREKISTHDNFFEIGGKSLTAIKMFSVINKKLKVKLSVTKLLEYTSISELSDFILTGSEPEPLQNIVPIRTKGDKTPLFCIHAGGGHVLFYGELKNYLNPERPIYAIQPSGINKTEDLHESIETMAHDYLNVIKKIQPNGPYNILVHCFSTTVGNEMSLILDKSGEKVNLIVVDSMATSWGGIGTATLSTRIDYFFKRLINSPVKTIINFVNERYRKLEPLIEKQFGKGHKKQLGKVQANLQKISATYEFKSHNGKVSLILTDKGDVRFENFHIESWEKYAKGGIEVYHTKGHHYTLFEKPDVESLSEQIELTIKD